METLVQDIIRRKKRQGVKIDDKKEIKFITNDVNGARHIKLQ